MEASGPPRRGGCPISIPGGYLLQVKRSRPGRQRRSPSPAKRSFKVIRHTPSRTPALWSRMSSFAFRAGLSPYLRQPRSPTGTPRGVSISAPRSQCRPPAAPSWAAYTTCRSCSWLLLRGRARSRGYASPRAKPLTRARPRRSLRQHTGLVHPRLGAEVAIDSSS